MSRCFPFPPPGYEKKAKTDDTNLLTKETHKEKKHKKEKKEKQKGEGKEKTEKDGTKEKHKEKKDRNEKHKDKEKDKTRNSDEKKVDKQSTPSDEEKFCSNKIQSNQNNDYKYVLELARRINVEDKISGSEILQRNSSSDHRGAGLFGKPLQRSIGKQSEEKDGARFKDEDRKKVSEQRNHIADRGLGKEFVNNSHMVKEKTEGIPIPAEKGPDRQVEGKEKIKNKDDIIKGEKRRSGDREEGKQRDKEQNKEKKKEEKTKEIIEMSKEQSQVRPIGLKLNDSSKASLGSQHTNKEKKKEERTKETIEPSKEQAQARAISLKLNDSSKATLDSQHTNKLDGLKLCSPSSASEGNFGKRKESEMNGCMLDNGNRPHKILRPSSSPAPIVENGRNLSCQSPIQVALQVQGRPNNSKAEITDCKSNGETEARQSYLRSPQPVPSNLPLNQNGEASAKPPHTDIKEASAKPPHPDIKYLSRVLSIPTVEELPNFDDEEWLFSSSLQLKKSDRNVPEDDETQQVWAEARWIETADVSALPYVIPY